jgi:hypothetical protein
MEEEPAFAFGRNGDPLRGKPTLDTVLGELNSTNNCRSGAFVIVFDADDVVLAQ